MSSPVTALRRDDKDGDFSITNTAARGIPDAPTQARIATYAPVGSRRTPREYFLALRAQGAVTAEGGEGPLHSLSENDSFVIAGRRLRRRGNLKRFGFIVLSVEQQTSGLRLPRRFAPRNDILRSFLHSET